MSKKNAQNPTTGDPKRSETKTSAKKQALSKSTSEYDASAILQKIQKPKKKERQEFVIGIDREEAKYLVKLYYQFQDTRIAAGNQLRSLTGQPKLNEEDEVNLEHRLDEDDEEKLKALEETLKISNGAIQWVFNSTSDIEKGIVALLKSYCESLQIGRWLLATVGIGPVIAAGLLSNFDYDKHQSAAKFLSYAGLNDNNRPWLGKEKAKDLINATIGDAPIRYEQLRKLSEASQWPLDSLLKVKKNKDGTYPREEVRKTLSKPPYNADLKTLCWKLGKSFVWFSPKDEEGSDDENITTKKKGEKKPSLYGKMYRDRKAYEMKLNEEGKYADQAAVALSKLKDKTTPTYEINSKGMLSPGHIDRRAARWVTKIFINHLFMEMEYERKGKNEFVPYIIAHGNHNDFIEPEVPFGSIS